MKSVSKILMVITALLSSMNGFAEIKPTDEAAQITSQLTVVFDNYFSIKDALVNSNTSIAATKAANMVTVTKAVNMVSFP